MKGNLVNIVRQVICLTSLGSTTFNQSIRNIAQIHTVFQQHVPEGKFQVWYPQWIDKHLTLNVYTRYFMPKCHANIQDIQPFQPWVDMHGFLTEMQATWTCHFPHRVVNKLIHYAAIRTPVKNA